MIAALIVAVLLFGGILAVLKKEELRAIWETYVKPNLPEKSQLPKLPKRPSQLVIEHRGKKIVVKRYPYTIGRSEGNDLVLIDKHISRLHAKIENRGTDKDPVYYLVDCNSTGGTQVDGRLCTERQLVGGEIITIGNEQLRISAGRGEGLHETQYIRRP